MTLENRRVAATRIDEKKMREKAQEESATIDLGNVIPRVQ